MKKYISLLIMAFLLSFTSSAQTTEDSISVEGFKEENKPMSLDIRVKSDPTSVVISSEAFEKNESLQKTLEVVYYQNSILSENLKELTKSISQEGKISENYRLLRGYDLNIVSMARDKYVAKILIYIMCILGSVIIVVANQKIEGVYKINNNILARDFMRIAGFSSFILFVSLLMYTFANGQQGELFNILQKLM